MSVSEMWIRKHGNGWSKDVGHGHGWKRDNLKIGNSEIRETTLVSFLECIIKFGWNFIALEKEILSCMLLVF